MYMDGELVARVVGQGLSVAGVLKTMLPRAAVIVSQSNLGWTGPLDVIYPLLKAGFNLWNTFITSFVIWSDFKIISPFIQGYKCTLENEVLYSFCKRALWGNPVQSDHLGQIHRFPILSPSFVLSPWGMSTVQLVIIYMEAQDPCNKMPIKVVINAGLLFPLGIFRSHIHVLPSSRIWPLLHQIRGRGWLLRQRGLKLLRQLESASVITSI